METEQCRTSRVTWSALSQVIATGCLLLVIAACWSSVLIVVLGHVIPSWVVSTTLLFVSLVLVRAAAARNLSEADRTTPRRLTLP